jgi:hypothetical protein
MSANGSGMLVKNISSRQCVAIAIANQKGGGW